MRDDLLQFNDSSDEEATNDSQAKTNRDFLNNLASSNLMPSESIETKHQSALKPAIQALKNRPKTQHKGKSKKRMARIGS